MFVQVIQGPGSDVEAVQATVDRWLRELEPGAEGWLGCTYGVTDDGTLIAVVRFESAEAAQRNAARPEQQAWWQEMESHFTGPVVFHDCPDVMVLGRGGSDDAKFVQVIQGRVRDRERAHALAKQANQSAGLSSAYRPDFIGATRAIDDEGYVTETIAFTSEADAREGERKEPPAELKQLVDEEMSMLEDTRFLDLRQPRFASRR
jgi:hypothetical protein